MARNLAVLGSTGSIGKSTLDVVREQKGAFRVLSLAARSSWEAVLAQVLEFRPHVVGMADVLAARSLREALKAQRVKCTVLDGPGRLPGTVSINGNVLPQAPKQVFNMTLKYTRQMTSSSEFFIYADVAHRGKVSFFLYDSKEYTGKALTETGLRTGYNWEYGKYELAGFVRNLGNQIRVVGGIDFNNLTGFINEPRMFGLQFKAKF